jgi:hypothetical protein
MTGLPSPRRVFRCFIWNVVLLWLLGHASYAQTVRTLPAAAVICWQEGLKLRWSDFQAPHNLTADTSAGAHTSAAIYIAGQEDAQGRPGYVVECFFVKKESWVRDSASSGNNALLAHEQLHFDIAELFARKIRHRIAQCVRNGCEAWGPEMDKEIKRLLQEQDAFDAAFDREANFETELGSFDETIRASRPRLHKWQALVRRELTALAPYKSSATTCSQKL